MFQPIIELFPLILDTDISFGVSGKSSMSVGFRSFISVEQYHKIYHNPLGIMAQNKKLGNGPIDRVPFHHSIKHPYPESNGNDEGYRLSLKIDIKTRKE
jgi:hypothetical protein